MPPPSLNPPSESLGRLFLRFLRFGLLAWGGPVAQIAMIKQELVDEERWVTPEQFNRVLSVYQILPGPEAHELCVYFGMLARRQLGGLLAGLGFMLPGFLLMFGLSWFYVTYGIQSPSFQGVLYGFQAAVAALIIRAIHRIGGHALHDRMLWGIAILALFTQLAGLPFLLTLGFSGLMYAIVKWRGALPPKAMLGLVPIAVPLVLAATPTIATLFYYGLRTGLLTFGGAYTAIPFLQHDAVVIGGWMTNQQFLDALALSSILPAPLIIFSTFVGYLGGGPWGALALTAGVFLPAFGFTLLAHDQLERLIQNTNLHAFLDGVTAGVVGLISATAIGLFRSAVPDLPALLIFLMALAALYRWKAKAAVAGVVLGAGLLGWAITLLI
ncbi:MAG: chromate efflux transporter [Chloroflexi bacterium]|nr:chromate efflux transporter [Chloroflexota bacterium]